METGLLQTKLYIPPVRPELVSRPRLIERMNEGATRKLTLISAPAGFGKTTLLSEWIHCRGAVTAPLRVAWLSLDEGDNDTARFLTYLIAALQTIESNVGQGLLGALQSPGQVNVESILTALLNQIAGLSDSLMLILDDYHVIESPAIDKALTFLLDHLPPQMHLCLATRTDPILGLSRLRARGQLTELRANDLRFSGDEATAFLDRVVHLPISPDDVHTVGRAHRGLDHRVATGRRGDAGLEAARANRAFYPQLWRQPPLCDRLFDRRGSRSTNARNLRVLVADLDPRPYDRFSVQRCDGPG